jgi:phospholipase D1/2
MDGKPVMANRFAATLRRQLFKEHLGLIPPQNCGHDEEVTPFMRAAPTSNPDETNTDHDKLVADPICDETLALWQDTARVNREVFTEVFRPVPTNLVRDWGAYAVSLLRVLCCSMLRRPRFQNYIPKVKVGHVVPGIDVRTVKDRLSRVRGALVEMPLDFLIDQKDFTENTTFSTYNPTLAVYI